MVALTEGFFCDRSPGRGSVTTATNASQSTVVEIMTGDKISGSANATTVAVNVDANPGTTLLVFVYTHDDDFVSVAAASGVSGGMVLRGGVTTKLKFYTGYVTSAMVGVAVTATVSGTAGVSIAVVPVRGIYDQTVGLFDPNALLPDTQGPDTGTGTTANITTTNPNTLLLYALGAKGPLSNFTDPSGWVGQLNTGYVLANLGVWTKVVTAVQAATAVAAGTSDSFDMCSIGDAYNGVL
jgi:hypothetical protein